MEHMTATAPKISTTPKKRRHSEYHDPDYGFNAETTQEKRVKQEPDVVPVPHDANAYQDVFNVDSVAQMNRIEDIVRAEFQKELVIKEQQLSEIDVRLVQARQLLDKLRYQVVSEYYRKQQVPLTPADVAKVRFSDTLFGDSTERAGPQLPLHPAIKKIVGKRPAPLQLHVPERTAAMLAKQTIRLRNPAHRRAERRRQQKIREQGIVTDHTQEQQNQPAAASCDDQPSTSRQAYKRQLELEKPVPALNASRLNNKTKFYFVVGNTSKYVGGADGDTQGSQALSYKWLVYVQGKSLPKPPETYLKKVRFQLHHSYRPNDIVDVHSPPFQLTRRGWGEFPMRIQLYFQDHLQQKPVQLMHNIVLDKTMCGLHTMGGETTVEVWLRTDDNELAPEKMKREAQPTPKLLQIDNSKPRTISITQNKEELDDNLFACINKVELSDDIEQIEPTVLVTEPLELSGPTKCSPKAIMPRTASHEPPPAFVPHSTINGNSFQQKQQLHNGHAKPQVRNVVFQKAGRLYIIDPLQTKIKQAAKQQSLLKPQLSLLKQPTQQLGKRWHMLECIQHDHGYANMSSQELLHVTTTTPRSMNLSLEQLFSSTSFQNMRSAVEFLLRRLELTGTPRSGFVFGKHTVQEFQAQPALRQRFFEYMRGRTLLRFMRQHLGLQHYHATGKEHFWSVREIVAFARLHGFTPPLKSLCVNRKKSGVDATPLSERVQQQLKEDPQPQLLAFCSLSSRSCLDSWILGQAKYLQTHLHTPEDQQSIDVLNVDAVRPRVRQKPNLTNTSINQQMLYIPPPQQLEPTMQLVREMCKEVGIVLDVEQCVPGVSQSLALTLLAHVLRMFIEKLVRRAVATKLQQQSSASDVLPLVAANLAAPLLPYDIGRVIAKSADLDFLGNSNLGVADMPANS